MLAVYIDQLVADLTQLRRGCRAAVDPCPALALRVNAEIEPKSKAQEAWQALADSRREDVRSGKVSMVLGNEALARVRARLN